MNSMNQKDTENERESEKERERETQREQSNREELVERITRLLPENGDREPIKGVRLARSTATGEPKYGVSDATFCITAQGSKEVFLGGHRYQYDPYNYLLATAELPIVSRVLAGSPQQPYLGLYIVIEPGAGGLSYGGDEPAFAAKPGSGAGHRSQPLERLPAGRDREIGPAARFSR